MLRLPAELRSAFKDPLGPVYTDAEELLREVDRGRDDSDRDDSEMDTDAPAHNALLVTVGDVVTHHVRAAGREPDVAVIDGMTERETVDAEISRALADAGDERVAVENPAAELSEALLEAVRESIVSPRATVVEVDGEEDLAALPAIVAAPTGSSVVYGQPGVGMVHVRVTLESTAEAVDLLREFDGDTDRAIDLLTS